MSLAEEVKKKSLTPRFILYGDGNAKNILLNAGFAFTQGFGRTLNEQIIELDNFDVLGKIVIADFINIKSLSYSSDLKNLLAAWRKKTNVFALIDGGFSQSARKKIKSLPIDVLVAPYFGEKSIKKAPYLQLVGPKYFIFSKAYSEVLAKNIFYSANKILVTCGGSDPLSISECILKSLSKISVPLEIKVIEGPLFKDKLKLSLRDFAFSSSHKVEILKAPKDIFQEMQWCDLAISTSGLTKYELALTGTPMISISIDSEHEVANENFLKQGTSISLGSFDKKKTPELINKNVVELLFDVDRRSSMSKIGQLLFDTHGAERVLREILNLNNL